MFFDLSTFLESFNTSTIEKYAGISNESINKVVEIHDYSAKELKKLETGLKSKARFQLILCIAVLISLVNFIVGMVKVIKTEKVVEDQIGYVISSVYAYDTGTSYGRGSIFGECRSNPISENFDVDLSYSATSSGQADNIRYIVMNTITGVAHTVNRGNISTLNGKTIYDDEVRREDNIYTYLPGQYINISSETRGFSDTDIELSFVPTVVNGLESKKCGSYSISRIH